MKLRARLKEHDAEDDRDKTRGVPRAGAALLQGLLYCGQCGQTMMAQSKGGPPYLGNALRQKAGVPVCQNMPAGWIAGAVVDASFQALAPLARAVYARAVAAQRPDHPCDPDNRLVAADLDARWEAAVRALKPAQDAPTRAQAEPGGPFVRTADLPAAVSPSGARLPQRWGTPGLSPPQRTARRRGLIDKVRLPRVAAAHAQVRSGWRGGGTPTRLVPLPGKGLAARPRGTEMAQLICARGAAGQSDAARAARLTALGHRSPASPAVFPKTVRCEVSADRVHGFERFNLQNPFQPS